MPGFPNGDTSQPFRYCYTWYEDANRHGTHTSGTIAAMRNGHGVVGVSAEGAQLYHYNYFGPNMAASDDLEVAAWQECIAELDRWDRGRRRAVLDQRQGRLQDSRQWSPLAWSPSLACVSSDL